MKTKEELQDLVAYASESLQRFINNKPRVSKSRNFKKTTDDDVIIETTLNILLDEIVNLRDVVEKKRGTAMNISFATCERGRALEFLKKVYPNKEITDTEDCAKTLLDFVEKDIVRVEDPLMYGKNIKIIEGTYFNDKCSREIKEAIMKFHK